MLLLDSIHHDVHYSIKGDYTMQTKICTKCNVEKDVEMFEKKYDGSPGRRRGQCRDCRPKKQARKKIVTKVCLTCEKPWPVDDYPLYYGSVKRKHTTQPTCKHCVNAKLRVKSRRYSKAWKDQAGGRCTKCGYDKCPAALDFHHRDPGTKLFQIAIKMSQCDPESYQSRMSQQVRAEMQKCDLLCANCHREEHHRLRSMNQEM